MVKPNDTKNQKKESAKVVDVKTSDHKDIKDNSKGLPDINLEEKYVTMGYFFNWKVEVPNDLNGKPLLNVKSNSLLQYIE